MTGLPVSGRIAPAAQASASALAVPSCRIAPGAFVSRPIPVSIPGLK